MRGGRLTTGPFAFDANEWDTFRVIAEALGPLHRGQASTTSTHQPVLLTKYRHAATTQQITSRPLRPPPSTAVRLPHDVEFPSPLRHVVPRPRPTPDAFLRETNGCSSWR